MIKVFHKLRTQLLADNKFSKYLLYAIGEIFLVVIGILIALQINTWNDQRNQRAKEVQYLKNIKKDLELNISHLDKFIHDRKSKIESAKIVLEYFEGKPLTNPELFFDNAVNIYTWKLFFQTNNTFQELVNTGDLALIQNDSIKNALLDLETLYNVMKAEEAHFRFDSEVTLYEPAYRTLDLNKLINNEQKGVKNKVEDFKSTLNDLKQKNGFVMALFEFGTIQKQLEQMKINSRKLIHLIDNEIN
ncbi:MAG: hypothetical protein JST48_01945 [Bacteroidetes bacterium]|nr:hypothetical protein [Bacteroidota bacterium]